MHKIFHVGLSGVHFMRCGEVASHRYNCTDDDSLVDCDKCLAALQKLKLTPNPSLKPTAGTDDGFFRKAVDC